MTNETYEVYLVFRVFLDNLENRYDKAVQKQLILITDNLSAAKSYCKDSRVFTEKDCWALRHSGKISEFSFMPVTLGEELYNSNFKHVNEIIRLQKI